MSTPESIPSPEVTATPEVENKETKSPETISTPESKAQEETKRNIEILDGVKTLCNTTLYVLTKGFYPGADAHLVNQAKEFIKEIKKDVELKRTAVANGQAVKLD